MDRRLPRAITAILLGSLVLVGGADWPRFRGPNGTGIVTDKDVPVKWSADNVLWKTPIPGKGNASPIITKGRIFLQTASDDGSERSLLCIDAETGKILWTRSAPGTSARTHQRNSLASSTASSDGERVYVPFWDGKELSLCAYSLAGDLVWKRDLGRFTSQHGAGHSPVVYEGLVYLANDQDGSAALLAFDAKSGKTVWEAKRQAFRSSYSTPYVLAGNGGTELIVASTAGITSYEPKSGSINWNYSWHFRGKPLRTVGSPVADNGIVIALSGDGSGARHAVAVRLGGKGDLGPSSLAWEEVRAFPYVPGPLIRGEHLYTVNDQGLAACHVLKTGERVWSERLNGLVTASPLMADGKIYSIAEDGQVNVFEAAPTYRLLAKNSVGEPVMASPAVADNRLYIRGKSHLYCIGKAPAK